MADLAAGWMPKLRPGAEAEHEMVGARRTGESKTQRQVSEMVTAAARNGSGRLLTGNRRTEMVDVGDGKPADDLQ